jgi:hypothetical protein
VWVSLDTNAADAATSTAITAASAKNFMLCLVLGQTQIHGTDSAPGAKATPVTNRSARRKHTHRVRWRGGALGKRTPPSGTAGRNAPGVASREAIMSKTTTPTSNSTGLPGRPAAGPATAANVNSWGYQQARSTAMHASHNSATRLGMIGTQGTGVESAQSISQMRSTAHRYCARRARRFCELDHTPQPGMSLTCHSSPAWIRRK